ncbi:HNH endonuclease, partial [Patescibacteria group bacterium]|nr:HNH endonuclease [Patescibacteria group bacterium]
PEVARRGLHRRKGFATIVEFAAKVGGVGKRTVAEVMRVERILEDKPQLKAMVGKVGINKVRLVASIASKENQCELVEKVQNMSKGALELFAREEKNANQEIALLRGNPANQEIPPGRDLTRERMSFSVDGKIALEMRKIKLRLEKERGEAIEWNDVMAEMVKAMRKPKAARPATAEKKIKITRYIPAAKKHELEDLYSGKCGAPGCNKPATEIHHVDGFARVRNHNNLIPLCHGHHELAHGGFAMRIT